MAVNFSNSSALRAAKSQPCDSTVPCPDGDNEVVFGGDGMVVDATFTDDVFDRYPADKLSELLLTMSEVGYAQVCEKVTAAVSAVLEQR